MSTSGPFACPWSLSSSVNNPIKLSGQGWLTLLSAQSCRGPETWPMVYRNHKWDTGTQDPGTKVTKGPARYPRTWRNRLADSLPQLKHNQDHKIPLSLSVIGPRCTALKGDLSQFWRQKSSKIRVLAEPCSLWRQQGRIPPYVFWLLALQSSALLGLWLHPVSASVCTWPFLCVPSLF